MQASDSEVHEQILQEAKLLFSHYGINKTSMEDIAKAINKTKSALYYYY